MIRMQAVVEARYYEDELLCPWQVAEFKPFALIPVCGEMTHSEIGLIFAQLAQYNQIELVNDQQSVLGQILQAEDLILPGGIQIVSEETISPSCCCGLENWREWIDFLQTGHSPWLGHDPSPWIESRGEIVRVWSDGGDGDTSKAFSIESI